MRVLEGMGVRAGVGRGLRGGFGLGAQGPRPGDRRGYPSYFEIASGSGLRAHSFGELASKCGTEFGAQARDPQSPLWKR